MMECSGHKYALIDHHNVHGLRATNGLHALTFGIPVNVQHTYNNNSHHRIFVTGRDRVPLLIESPGRTSTNIGNDFHVNVRYSMTLGALRAINEHYYNRVKEYDAIDQEIIQCVQRELQSKSGLGDGQSATFTVTFSYKLDKVSGGDGVGYIPELDLLIEMQGFHGKVPHPFSRVNTNRAPLLNAIPGNTLNSHVFSLRIIDNSRHRRIADRYVNFGGEIYHVGVEQDASLKDGVHVVVKHPATHQHEGIMSTRVFTYEEADKVFGLRLNMEEARRGGDSIERAKWNNEEVLAKFRLDEIARKQSLAKAEYRYKVQQMHLTRSDAVLKLSEQKLKYKAMVASYEQAMRGSVIKDFKEITGIVVAALGAIKALAILMR